MYKIRSNKTENYFNTNSERHAYYFPKIFLYLKILRKSKKKILVLFISFIKIPLKRLKLNLLKIFIFNYCYLMYEVFQYISA